MTTFDALEVAMGPSIALFAAYMDTCHSQHLLLQFLP